MRRSLPLVLLLSLVVVAPAGAATVSSSTTSFHDPGGKGFPPTTIVTRHIAIAAAPGEVNALVVSTAGGAVTVRDVGAALVAGAGCALGGDGAVTCAAGDGDQIALKTGLGDGDDRLEVAGIRTPVVDAGPGADVVTSAGGGELDGGEGDDRLVVGGPGVLRGGPGADVLAGSPSSDTLDGGSGTDDLDAGAGIDTLSYAGRPDGVVVDLGAPVAGAPGEKDRIAGFENATGGDGADVLRAVGAELAAAADDGAVRPSLRGGDAGGATLPGGWDATLHGFGGDDLVVGGATLRGGGGDDLVVGGAGKDELDGDAGNDRVAGGAGDDSVEGGPGDDALDGGAGKDHLVARDGADVADGGPGDDQLEDLGGDGGHADVFRGGDGDDSVYRGGTADGGPGDDDLYGGAAGRRLIGGPGDDSLSGPRSVREARRVDCGPGRDTLTRPADRVPLPAGCERVEPWYSGDTALRIPPRVRGRVVTVGMPQPCLFAYADARCRVKATLTVGGRRAGTREARWRGSWQRARVLRWTLPRRVRRGDVVWLRLVKYETGESTERGGYSVRLR